MDQGAGPPWASLAGLAKTAKQRFAKQALALFFMHSTALLICLLWFKVAEESAIINFLCDMFIIALARALSA